MPLLKVRNIRQRVEQERSEALAVRDPLAISYASERYKVIEEVFESFRDEQAVDPEHLYLSASQAGRMLGYKPREIHLLLRLHRLVGHKDRMSKEWKVPLSACL